MNKSVFRILFIFVAILVMSVLAIKYIFKDTEEDLSKTPADYRLTADELVNTFQKDEAKAAEMYAGQVLQVEGELQNKLTDEWGQTSLIFIDPLFGLTAVIDSVMSVKQSDALEKLKPGAIVIVKGRCDGMLTDVRLTKCMLINQ